MRLVQAPRFRAAAKKLHPNQKSALDEAVRAILAAPDAAEAKTGDLAGIRVCKFRMVGQLTLLAYEIDVDSQTLTLLVFGPHENFYRDLKTH